MMEDGTEGCNAAGPGHTRREPGAKGCSGFQETERTRKWTVPTTLEEDCSLANTSIFTQRGLCLTRLRYNLGCFKPLC